VRSVSKTTELSSRMMLLQKDLTSSLTMKGLKSLSVRTPRMLSIGFGYEELEICNNKSSFQNSYLQPDQP
jgi:hypothetical protein